MNGIASLHIRQMRRSGSGLAVKLVEGDRFHPDGLLEVVPGKHDVRVREVLHQEGFCCDGVPKLVARLWDVQHKQGEAQEATSSREGGPPGTEQELDRAMI
jgi:hypothetical protein